MEKILQVCLIKTVCSFSAIYAMIETKKRKEFRFWAYPVKKYKIQRKKRNE